MEKFLKIETEHENHTTEIKVDNTTDFKDLRIAVTSKNKEVKTLDIKLSQSKDKEETWKRTVCLEIGNINLFNREVEMLKEFLNQI